MIKILIMIQVGLILGLSVGCGGGDGDSNPPDEVRPDTSVSGNTDDPLRQLEEEGKLPQIGGGAKTPVIENVTPPAADGLSLYPPLVDPDQDNVPSLPIFGHPEIAVDNCPNDFNPGQEDANANHVGDACE